MTKATLAVGCVIKRSTHFYQHVGYCMSCATPFHDDRRLILCFQVEVDWLDCGRDGWGRIYFYCSDKYLGVWRARRDGWSLVYSSFSVETACHGLPRRHLAYARIWIWNTELEKIHSSIGRAQSFQIDNAHRCWVSIRLIDPPWVGISYLHWCHKGFGISTGTRNNWRYTCMTMKKKLGNY
jgi:hypothetical protein